MGLSPAHESRYDRDYTSVHNLKYPWEPFCDCLQEQLLCSQKQPHHLDSQDHIFGIQASMESSILMSLLSVMFKVGIKRKPKATVLLKGHGLL